MVIVSRSGRRTTKEFSPSGAQPHRSRHMKHVLIDVDLQPQTIERLSAVLGALVQFTPPPHEGKARTFPANLLRDAHVLLCKTPPTNFADLRSLEVIQLVSVGFEHMASLNLHESHVRVCNARGLFDTAIGEWNLAMMVNLVRDVRGMIRNQESKTWDRGARFHQEVRDKVVGLWGYGGIGRETARLARAFGMTVHVLTRSGVRPRQSDYTPAGTGDPDGRLPDKAFVRGQEHQFLGGLDFLVLALPRTAQTDGMVGEAELRALPRRALLLKLAGGPIILEQALLRALPEGWIAGAALDTHYAYPLPPAHPLWSMPNVILTPHISGAELSSYYQERIGKLFQDNLERYLSGRSLFNEVTKDEWRETGGVPS